MTLSSFKKYVFYFLFTVVFISCKSKENKSSQKSATARPNILFAVIDDASYPYFGAYGADWLDTPNFDRVAAEGLLFMNAFVPNSKCAPSRAMILTGRNSWQLGNAANHQSYFPKRFQTFVEALGTHGYVTGYTGKPWAPGNPGKVNGHPRRLVGKPYNQVKTTPPTPAMSSIDYAANFKQFLKQKPEGEPFFFWYGSHEAHRGYAWRSGIEQGGMKKSDIDFIPGYLPDNDTVRTDLLDYGFEIEYFDQHLGRMLELLKERGELHNTLVVVTSDNGIPFPGAKGQLYYGGSHMPLAIMWPAGINNPGRKIQDFVSFIDFAPTFLQVAGINPKTQTEMQSITGHSLVYIFKSTQSGWVDARQDYVLVGKERHDVGRPHDRGYPIRGIITEDYQYLYNFKPDRWPAGNPETGYLNIDGSPTKTWILNHKKDSTYSKYWYHAMGKRRARELYNINKDPATMHNLLCRQEHRKKYRSIADSLHKLLFNVLKWQSDARMFGRARQVFYSKPYASPNTRNFYQRFMNGELTKKDAGWVNPSDFESKHPMNPVRRPCPADKNN